MIQYMYAVIPGDGSANIQVLSLDLELAEDPHVFVDFFPMILFLRKHYLYDITLSGCIEYKEYVAEMEFAFWDLKFDCRTK